MGLRQGTMIHLNGNILCSIDVKTTGLNSIEHEIFEIGIVPLDSFLNRRRDLKPLDLSIRPNYPDKIDWNHLERQNTKATLQKVMQSGLPAHVGREIFERWLRDLNLRERKRIAPVGYNYSFENRFLRQWLGDLSYREVFDDTETRDVITVARFLNDMADIRQSEYPFKKVRLVYLASKLKVWADYGRHRSAIHDAAITGDVYKALLELTRKEMIQ